jgi:hypothetical protein
MSSDRNVFKILVRKLLMLGAWKIDEFVSWEERDMAAGRAVNRQPPSPDV